jgi:hypothetical protein
VFRASAKESGALKKRNLREGTEDWEDWVDDENPMRFQTASSKLKQSKFIDDLEDAAPDSVLKAAPTKSTPADSPADRGPRRPADDPPSYADLEPEYIEMAARMLKTPPSSPDAGMKPL